jgi:Acyl carrier protein
MLEKLSNIIREHTGDNSMTINENTVLISDLGLSSLDLVNLVCTVEDEFDVEIPDRAIKGFKTVGDVMNFIEKQ